MSYTVKEVAELSGVSVRTLHFYDETELLKPAAHAANGYRLYEEPQLLTLQQILFYRELGFPLKQIKEIVGRADFEKVTALQSHRSVLEEELARTRTLIDTIDRTIEHLKGIRSMSSGEMFAGFHVAAGQDRFAERVELGGEPNDCKVSSRDTAGAMCIFEFHGSGGGPRHLHVDQNEWIYVLEGDFDVEIGERTFRVGAGESVYIPRKVGHAWSSANGRPGRIINVYEPAGRMEEFFREIGKYVDVPIHEALTIPQLRELFAEHGLELLGPPLGWDDRRI